MTGARGRGGWYARWGKRALDVAAGGALLALLAPLLAVLTLIALAAHGRPVLFKQERPGKNGRPFVLTKYRTMRPARDGHAKDDSVRLTRFGRFLRGTSLDELPELWCVLRGDMSLVGPRPLLMEYLPLYSARQSRRHAVRPGLTGWAQIHGRNATSWEERFENDLWYVDHCSFGLDLRILVTTLWKVLRGEGISAAEHATMPKFTGGK